MTTKIVPIHHALKINLATLRYEKFACGLNAFNSNCWTNDISLVTCKNCIRAYHFYKKKLESGKDSRRLRELKARYEGVSHG